MPGVEGLTAQGDDAYTANMRVKVGPVALTLEGQVKLLDRDGAAHRLVMDLQGRERRVGGTAKGTVILLLTEDAPNQTVLSVDADYQILGRLGELGQPIVRRKAESTFREFAEAVGEKAGAQG